MPDGVWKYLRKLGSRLNRSLVEQSRGIVRKEQFDLAHLATYPRYWNQSEIRSHCYNAYLGKGTSLCRVLGRYDMFVDTEDMGFTPHILMCGFWEIWVTEAIVTRIRPGMRAVDCGANLGYFTLLLADLVGPTGSVDAFEPNPAIATRLRNTLAVNGFADRAPVHQIALAEAAGETFLHIPPGEPKNGYLNDQPGLDPLHQHKVTIGRMDELLAADEIDFIKIDVEGAEERVWAGMEHILEQRRPLTIVLEFATVRYPDPGAFIDRMIAQGFALEVIDPIAGVLSTTRQEILARPGDIDQMLILTR